MVAEKGYDETRVEDILLLAGVSRSAFYRHFANKHECFVATLEAINGFALPVVVDAFERTPGPWDDKLAATLGLLADMVATQPAAARLSCVEFYAGGPDAVAVIEILDRAIEDQVCHALRESPERAAMPREIVRAVVGGVRKIVHTRVLAGSTGELPELMPDLFEWMQSYHSPPEPLGRSRGVPDELVFPARVPADARERMLDAIVEIVAEKGYADMTLGEIATRSAVSLSTFYAHFEGKEAAFVEALSDLERQVFGVTAELFARAPDWPTAVAVGMRAFLAYLATHPTLARVGGIDVWTVAPAALTRRTQGMALFESLLDGGFRDFPGTNPVSREAIGATVDALLFDSLSHRSAERLYEMASTAIFLTLTPFVGADRAVALANADLVEIGQTTS